MVTKRVPKFTEGNRLSRQAKRRPRHRFVGKRLFDEGVVSSKGWVVIPKAIRDEMGLRPGDRVQFSLEPPLPNMKQDRGLYLLNIVRVPEDPVALTSGMFRRGPGEPLMTDRLIAERRLEREQEERAMREASRRRRTPA